MLDKSKAKWIGLAVVAVCVLVSLVARSKTNDNGGSNGVRSLTPVTATDVNQQIQGIKNNPHIPEDQKESMIAMIKLRASGEGAAGYGPVGMRPKSGGVVPH